MVNLDDMLRSIMTVNDDAPPPAIDWAKVMQDAQETLADGYFNGGLPTLSHGPIAPPYLPALLTRRDDISRGDEIRWVNCHLLSVGAKKGCPRVYMLMNKLRGYTPLDRIGVPDLVVTALYWSHMDALSTFLDMKRPLVYFLFHNWVGESGRWAENSRFCIKREGIEVTVNVVCHAYLTETDQLLQVGFLKGDTLDEWVVGCVYTLRSRGKRAWLRKGSVNSDMSIEESITTLKASLGAAPAYMCSIFEP